MFKYHSKSILRQLIAIVLLILVVITTTILLAHRYTERLARSTAETFSAALYRQADDALNLLKNDLRYYSAFMCSYPVINDLIFGAPEEKSSAEARISSYFSQVTQRNNEIRAAQIYDKDMNLVALFGKEVELPADRLYLRTEESITADYLKEDCSDYIYAYYYPISNALYGSGQQIGMCVFILDHWIMDGAILNTLGDASAAILLSDSKYLDLAFYKRGDIQDNVTMEELKNSSSYAYTEGSWEDGIRICVAVAIEGNSSGTSVIRPLIITAYVLSLALLSITILFSYSQLVRPIREISSFINRAIRHPDDRLNMDRVDEIGVVASNLDNLLDENQKILQQVMEGKIRLYETELSRQKMEILAYRNQINPHFLYNTLSCMRDMALIQDAENIAEMSLALSDIFRYAVKGSNIVTIRDEIEYIQKYARIIDYRFMGKITIDVHADEEVQSKPIIRFSLQPLVENAVFHGLEASVEPGFVDVGISLEGDRIRIVVEDDGCGMDAEKLASLQYELENPGENSGVGLSNVVQRLRLFYGKDYSVDVDSTDGEGTIFKITIPDHIKEEGSGEIAGRHDDAKNIYS